MNILYTNITVKQNKTKKSLKEMNHKNVSMDKIQAKDKTDKKNCFYTSVLQSLALRDPSREKLH